MRRNKTCSYNTMKISSSCDGSFNWKRDASIYIFLTANEMKKKTAGKCQIIKAKKEVQMRIV